jgi:hypothetical protein
MDETYTTRANELETSIKEQVSLRNEKKALKNAKLNCHQNCVQVKFNYQL